MLTAPIPLFLLPHNADVIRKTESDGWGGGETETYHVSHIRIAPAHSQVFAMSGDLPQVSAKLFFDSRNSKPTDFEFCTGDIVRFTNTDFVVQSIESHYADTGELHHVEVVLR